MRYEEKELLEDGAEEMDGFHEVDADLENEDDDSDLEDDEEEVALDDDPLEDSNDFGGKDFDFENEEE